MENKDDTLRALRKLDEMAPLGYAIALHIRFTAPRFLFQTYDESWMKLYSEQGLVLKDPTVLWGFENTGTIRWSELGDHDPAGVLDLARENGLAYGFTYATREDNMPSIASFAREDREFRDAEIAQIIEIVEEVRRNTAELDSLTPEQCEALRQLSISFTHGQN